jgi:hypothetical protein
MGHRVIDNDEPQRRSDALGVRQTFERLSDVAMPPAQSSIVYRSIGNHGLQRMAVANTPLSDSLGHAMTKQGIRGLEWTRALQDDDATRPEDDLRELQIDAGTPDARPATPSPDGGSDAGPKTGTPSASIAITGDGSYSDTATRSNKSVKFNVTWSGGHKEDFIIVNWVKGYMKDSTGKPFKAKIYGSTAEINFADYQIDSQDEDPAYWSDSSGRWNYDVDGADKFSATDNPGPMNNSDGKGAQARLDFKTGVYKSSDVPTKTTGTISATPFGSLVTWTYYVTVLGGGKFDHK